MMTPAPPVSKISHCKYWIFLFSVGNILRNVLSGKKSRGGLAQDQPPPEWGEPAYYVWPRRLIDGGRGAGLLVRRWRAGGGWEYRKATEQEEWEFADRVAW